MDWEVSETEERSCKARSFLWSRVPRRLQPSEEPERKRGKGLLRSAGELCSHLAVPQEARGAEPEARLCLSLAGVHPWGADAPGPLIRHLLLGLKDIRWEAQWGGGCPKDFSHQLRVNFGASPPPPPAKEYATPISDVLMRKGRLGVSWPVQGDTGQRPTLLGSGRRVSLKPGPACQGCARLLPCRAAGLTCPLPPQARQG